MRFANKKIVVVGGAGFVGSNLVHKLVTEGPKQIIVIDNLLSAEKENLPDSPIVQFIEASITDDSVLDSLHDDIDYIFHLSTFHGNQNSMFDPLADHEHNTLTSLKLFNKVSKYKQLQKLVYSSAGCVVAEKTYDDAKASTEDALPSLFLDSPYQISKMIGEFYGNYYFKQYGMPFVKARFQNVYGPREVLGAGVWRGTESTIWRNVTPSFIYRALQEMPLLLDNEGASTRDFIFVNDIVEGLILCALNGEAGECYNLASGMETSIKELAEQIISIANSKSELQLLPKRDWDHSGKRFGSTEKAEKELGFRATTDLENGLQETIDWTIKNLSWIQKCMDKHKNK